MYLIKHIPIWIFFNYFFKSAGKFYYGFKLFNKLSILKNRHCKWFPVCPMKNYWEQRKIEKHWIDDYCKGNWEKCVRYEKEENGIYHPDNMLPNGDIDKKLI